MSAVYAGMRQWRRESALKLKINQKSKKCNKLNSKTPGTVAITFKGLILRHQSY
jgi:hypothetical protein